MAGLEGLERIKMTNLPPKRIVLVVDDDPMVLEVAEAQLKRLGYRPLLANNGLEGLTKLQEHNPDAVCSDTQMPEMDGLSFCRRAREMGYRKPFVGTSNSGITTLSEEWADAGATGYHGDKVGLYRSKSNLGSFLDRAFDYHKE